MDIELGIFMVGMLTGAVFALLCWDVVRVKRPAPQLDRIEVLQVQDKWGRILYYPQNSVAVKMLEKRRKTLSREQLDRLALVGHGITVTLT